MVRGRPQVLELYSVPIDASAAPVKLNGALVSGGDLADQASAGAPFRISPDASLVVYRADQETDNLVDLYLVPIDRSLEPIALTRSLARPGVSFPEITPDSRRVLYTATERSGVTELFSTVLTLDPKRGHAAEPGQHTP